MLKEKGFAPVLVVFAVAAIGILLISANRFTNPTSHKVAGLEIAKGDDSSGSSGESSSGSGGSGSSSTGTSGGSSGSSGEIRTTSTPRPTTTSVQEVENQQNQQEAENENEVETAEDVGEFQAKVNDGELEFEAKEASDASKLARLKNTTAVKVKLNGKELELQAENDHINLKLGNIEAETRFPLTIDQATGQLMVITPNGPRPIRVLPDQASQVAQSAGVQNKIDKLEILSSTSGTDSVVIKLTGAKTGSILGLIPINQPVETEVGAQTGQIVNINAPFWLTLLSPLIRS